MASKLIIPIVIALLYFSANCYSGTIKLCKTGQTKCYDTLGAEIACFKTGQDGEFQAGVTWPDPRFSVDGECIIDNLTGLMWTKSPDSTYRNWRNFDRT